MTTQAHPKERCPTCHGLVGRPNNVIDREAVIDPPPEITRYLAVWAFNRTIADLPDMAQRIHEVLTTEGCVIINEPGEQ